MGDQINEVYYGRLFSKQTQANTRDRIHWICARATGKRVLDVGCSQGIASILLAREGFSVLGIDADQKIVDQAESELSQEPEAVQQHLSFKCADVLEIELEPESYDTVIVGQLLNHFLHPERVLERVWTGLKPGGRLILTVPFAALDNLDYKQTFYAGGLLELVMPFTEPIELALVGGQLCYVGTRRPKVVVSPALADITTARVGEDLLTALYREIAQERLDLIQDLSQCKEQLQTMKAAFGAVERQLELTTVGLQVAEACSQSSPSGVSIGAAWRAIQKAVPALVESGQHSVQELQGPSVQAYETESAPGALDRIQELESQLLDLAKERTSLRNELEVAEQALASMQALEKAIAESQTEVEAYQSWHRVVDEVSAWNERAAGYQEKRWAKVMYDRDQVIQHLSSRLAALEGSTKYQLGSLLVEGARKPWLLPRQLLKAAKLGLAAAHRRRKKVKRRLPEIALPAVMEAPKPLRLKPVPVQKSQPVSTSVTVHLTERREDHLANEVQHEIEIPEVKLPTGPVARPHLKVAAIMDTFSRTAFEYEFQYIAFGPDNWKQVIEQEKPNLLMVESAWGANNDQWRGYIAGPNAPHQVLKDLVNWCKERDIPTVFWNKEDPPNFEHFIKAASLFDYVFTVAEEMVERYKAELGHDRVGVLPFAAQPRIHNPTAVAEGRPGDVAFAGSYYARKHPDRKVQMDAILQPARKFSFHIYDRNFYRGADSFRWPDEYQPHIRGGLTYEQTLVAYKMYKIFLNVNSVIGSSTMCARRIFELLACGTGIVSGYSPAIDRLFGDLVALSANSAETERKLKMILTNDELRSRLAVRGVRRVLTEHTYGQRVDMMLETIGLAALAKPTQVVSLIIPVHDAQNMSPLIAQIAAQTYRPLELILVASSMDAASRVKEKAQQAGIDSVETCFVSGEATLGQVVTAGCRVARGAFVGVMEPAHYYAPEYIQDIMLAFQYSDATIVGKAAHFAYLPSENHLVAVEESKAYQYVNWVVPTAMIWQRDFVTYTDQFDRDGEAFFHQAKMQKHRIYAVDGYNFLYCHDDSLADSFCTVLHRPEFENARLVTIGRHREHVVV